MDEDNESTDRSATWTIGLFKVDRLDPDAPDEKEQFAVEFELLGPGTNATVTVVTVIPRDEADVINMARNAMRDGLKKWLRVLEYQAVHGSVASIAG